MMLTQPSGVERNKFVTRMYYECGQRGDLTAFYAFAHPDFTVIAPDYLPWGGIHRGLRRVQETLPIVSSHVDFRRFVIDSLTAEDNRVAALIQAGVVGSDSMVRIAEHWEFEDGLATSLWAAYFEPGELMRRIAAGDHP
jgi:hypothetical protein